MYTDERSVAPGVEDRELEPKAPSWNEGLTDRQGYAVGVPIETHDWTEHVARLREQDLLD